MSINEHIFKRPILLYYLIIIFSSSVFLFKNIPPPYQSWCFIIEHCKGKVTSSPLCTREKMKLGYFDS